jgi:hypothetical protein
MWSSVNVDGSPTLDSVMLTGALHPLHACCFQTSWLWLDVCILEVRHRSAAASNPLLHPLCTVF